MPTADKLWKDITDHDGIDRTACVEPRGMYNPSPEDDWKAFERKFQHSFAMVMGHDEASFSDRAALRDVFNKHYEPDWLLAKLVKYAGTREFQRRKANAYWLRNRLDDDWKNQARDSRGWWGKEYEKYITR